MTWNLTLLDGFRLAWDGRECRLSPGARRLVALLGVDGGGSRARIAGTLWPEATDERAHANLRTTLWRLRRRCVDPIGDGEELLTVGETLGLVPGVRVDVTSFVAAVRHTLDPTSGPLNGYPMNALVAAGELLPGWYEDWVLGERERLRTLRLHALEALAERLTSARRYPEAVEAALAAVRAEPLRESATRALIAAHLAANNLAEAVRRFESFKDTLTTELGVRPTPELERLVRSGLSRPG
jgi:DNA-binding SARP family transcriptional activator